ncbi:hypothetical protein AD932_10495, partial [Gluconobacter oxydans]
GLNTKRFLEPSIFVPCGNMTGAGCHFTASDPGMMVTADWSGAGSVGTGALCANGVTISVVQSSRAELAKCFFEMLPGGMGVSSVL